MDSVKEFSSQAEGQRVGGRQVCCDVFRGQKAGGTWNVSEMTV